MSFILDFVEDLGINPRTICAVPDSATPFGIMAQERYILSKPESEREKYPIVMIRKVPKSHGDARDKYCIGTPVPPILLLENTITTGSAVIETINFFKKSGIKVENVISLMDRLESPPIPGVDTKETVENYKKIVKEATGASYIYKKGLSAKDVIEKTGAKYHSLSDASILKNAIQLMDIDSNKIEKLTEEQNLYGTQRISLLKAKRGDSPKEKIRN